MGLNKNIEQNIFKNIKEYFGGIAMWKMFIFRIQNKGFIKFH